MEKNFELLLQDGLQMIELEERLEMVQLTASMMCCCFDSNSHDSASASAEASMV